LKLLIRFPARLMHLLQPPAGMYVSKHRTPEGPIYVIIANPIITREVAIAQAESIEKGSQILFCRLTADLMLGFKDSYGHVFEAEVGDTTYEIILANEEKWDGAKESDPAYA